MIAYFVGLDISQKRTAICVIDPDGTPVCEGAAYTRPADIYGWLNNRIALDQDIRIGLEAGTFSTWLYRGLSRKGFELVVMDTFQAHRFLATMRNKTDRNDARGLAQLVRMGGADFLRVVHIRSQASQETRSLLASRWHLITLKVSLENHIAGILKPYGVVARRGGVVPETFRDNIITAIRDAEVFGVDLMKTVIPMLDLYRAICRKIEPMTARVEQIANDIPMTRRFMAIPGVGPITALSF